MAEFIGLIVILFAVQAGIGWLMCFFGSKDPNCRKAMSFKEKREFDIQLAVSSAERKAKQREAELKRELEFERKRRVAVSASAPKPVATRPAAPEPIAPQDRFTPNVPKRAATKRTAPKEPVYSGGKRHVTE